MNDLTTRFPQLAHPDPLARVDALEAISYEGDEALTVEAAAYMLADPDPGVRETAGRLLARLGTPEAARQTARHIASPDITVRNLAGELLAGMGEPAIEALAPYVDDADYDVRKFAIDVLALLPAERLAPRVAAHLNDPDANVRIAAVDALCAFRAADFADALRALYDAEPVARPSIVAAFGAFGPGHDMTLLEEALSDEDPVVQFAAAEALAEWQDPRIFHLLMHKLREIDPLARPVVLKALVTLWEAHPELATALPGHLREDLLEMVQDIDLDYARAAARGLHVFLDEGVVDVLLEHTGRDDALDLAIFQALAEYSGAFGCIERACEAGTVSPDLAAQLVLGLFAQGALPEAAWEPAGAFLGRHFETIGFETRLAALGMAQRLAHPAFAPVVRAGLHEEDPTLRSYAEEAALEAGFPSDAGSVHS